MLWQGNAIYAEIPANLADQKAPDIEEGRIYNISRFRVCAAKNAFKVVDGDKMIQFTFYTIVKHGIDPPTVFPKYVYRLTPFDQIKSNIQTKPNFLGITTQRLRLYYLLVMAYVHLSNISLLLIKIVRGRLPFRVLSFPFTVLPFRVPPPRTVHSLFWLSDSPLRA
jgi:hypothetical protein